MIPQTRPLLRGSRWSALALFTLVSPIATADEEAPSLEPIIVVSTRTPLSKDRVSPSVSFIPAEEIEFWKDRQLIDTLQRLPGMTLWSNGAIGSVSSLSIRGTESNHTSMFLDGRRLSPGFGNDYDLSFLTPQNASSVEIQRGPSSVQYGSSNIGGVIDTRMKSGLDTATPEGSIFAEYGSNSFIQSGFDSRTGSDKFGVSLAGSSMGTDNERANDAFEQSNLTSRFDARINDQLSFELVGTWFDNDKALPGPITTPTPFNNQQTTSWLISPGVRYLSDEISAHLFYSRAERTSDIFEVNSAYDYSAWPIITYLGDFPIRNSIDVISDEINLQADYSLPHHSLLTFGAVFRNDEVLNTNIQTYNVLATPVPYQEGFQQLGTYAQLLWMLSDDLELRSGIRYDDYSEYDNETTGNLMGIYHLRGINAALFTKAATSYAPPSAVDLAYDSDTSTTLNAERSQSYEIGFQQKLLDEKLNYSVTAFRNEIDDLLSYEPSTFDTFNVEQATTQGLETSVTYQLIRKCQLGLGYTYMQADSDRLNDPRTSGLPDPAKNVPLARRPRHIVQASAKYQASDDISIGLQAIGQFRRQDINPSTYLQEDAEDFITLRLIADWSINKDWSLFGRIENLLDQSYATAAGFPALGRTAYFGAKYQF